MIESMVVSEVSSPVSAINISLKLAFNIKRFAERALKSDGNVVTVVVVVVLLSAADI